MRGATDQRNVVLINERTPTEEPEMTVTAPVRTSHADCSHASTKVARAACRRGRKAAEPTWVLLARTKSRKGMTVRVHTDDATVEGTLLGWGTQRLMLRDTTDKHRTFVAALVRKVETPAS